MLAEQASLLYVGGAGSCMGCGEATAIRMMLAATGFVHGPENLGIVAATGCNTVYGSTYPYNPYIVPWTNSLFENAPADAMGMRARWDQRGWEYKKLWVIGGDGAMYDIGLQSLSRMLASGMDIKVLVLDTQVYSNTGGQASTATFTAQDAKMASFGKEGRGKRERRKELSQICLTHPDVFVAQTTAAHINHFYKAIIEANDYPGPAVINVYTTCQPEHGVPDCNSVAPSQAGGGKPHVSAVHIRSAQGRQNSRALESGGQPGAEGGLVDAAAKRSAATLLSTSRAPKDASPNSSIATASHRTALLLTQQDRLQNWHVLQELAGLRYTEEMRWRYGKSENVCRADRFFSRRRTKAFDYALRWRAKVKRSLCALNVVPAELIYPPTGGQFDFYGSDGARCARSLCQVGEAQSHQTARVQARFGARYRFRRVIVRQAKKLRAEMIIMGSHGRTGLRRLLLGSVAERTLRYADCPVLIVK